MFAQQYDPVFTLTPMTSCLVRAALNHAGAGLGAAEGVRPGVNGIAQHFVNRVVNRQPPARCLPEAAFVLQRG
jgi:hypothetical protein